MSFGCPAVGDQTDLLGALNADCRATIRFLVGFGEQRTNMTGPLCAFSQWFSADVGRELTEGRRIGHQWWETTWTDRMLKELRALGNPRIIVTGSNEAVTGADMDWWFVDRSGQTHIGLFLQSKVLHYRQTNSALWAYDELAHPRHSPGQQAKKLIGHALRARKAGTAAYPLYLFYNCDREVPHTGSYPAACPGVTIANGYAIARHIRINRTGKSFPIAAKRFSAIAPVMMRLSWLLCALSLDDIPTPDEIALILAVDRDRIVTRREGLDLDPRAIPRPKIGNGVPTEVERLIALAGHDTDYGDPPTRNTVIFLSGG